LIHYEQGFGDNIQFIRYAPQVRRRVGRVIFEAPRQLCALFERCAGIDEVIEAKPHPPGGDFDYHVSPLDLPRIFSTTLDTIPADVPYVFADADRVKSWRKRLRGDGFNVGIVWAGSPAHGRDASTACKRPPAERLRDTTGPGGSKISETHWRISLIPPRR